MFLSEVIKKFDKEISKWRNIEVLNIQKKVIFGMIMKVETFKENEEHEAKENETKDKKKKKKESKERKKKCVSSTH